MTTELTLLAWTLVLALVQILAFDVARTAQYGTRWNTGARDADMPPLSPVAERLRRAQNNLFETLPLFIAAVLILHVAGIHTARTLLACELYFWARVVYVPLYALGVPWLRSLVWVVSFAGLVMLLFAILA
ncbi:MAPEG family protein [Sphingosinicellaceae bacterium]|nr:MAPEG family protein [Sphingosinicellaceae bacterium]